MICYLIYHYDAFYEIQNFTGVHYKRDVINPKPCVSQAQYAEMYLNLLNSVDLFSYICNVRGDFVLFKFHLKWYRLVYTSIQETTV